MAKAFGGAGSKQEKQAQVKLAKEDSKRDAKSARGLALRDRQRMTPPRSR